jgi:hypothetical protein
MERTLDELSGCFGVLVLLALIVLAPPAIVTYLWPKTVDQMGPEAYQIIARCQVWHCSRAPVSKVVIEEANRLCHAQYARVMSMSQGSYVFFFPTYARLQIQCEPVNSSKPNQ